MTAIETNLRPDVQQVSREVQTRHALGFIDGYAINRDLLDIAWYNGTPLPPTPTRPEGYATNRLALTPEDTFVREEMVGTLMEQLGMEVIRHPLGIFGVRRGTNPELAPVVMGSHLDTVYAGDRVDDIYGVMGALHGIDAMNKTGISTSHDVVVAAFTGEESSRFNTALFGSNGATKGLTDEDLKMRKTGDLSIGEALELNGVDLMQMKAPIFGEGHLIPSPHAFIELHVDQDGRTPDGTVGVVEKIAGPQRFKVTIGETVLKPDTKDYPFSKAFAMTIQGKADHSGATPMGETNRADGLVVTAEILSNLGIQLAIVGGEQTDPAQLQLGDITIPGGAMNKIPGEVTTKFRIIADTEKAFARAVMLVHNQMIRRNEEINAADTPFENNPVTIVEDTATKDFFAMGDRLEQMCLTVEAVNLNAEHFAEHAVVGTVGTINFKNGITELGVDIRGLHKETRDAAITNMQGELGIIGLDFGKPLRGSGDPVDLDQNLIAEATTACQEYGIQTVRSNSAAGHDAMNFPKAGHPAVMLFVKSEDGLAHNPEADTKIHNLENGAKALLATVLRLAA